MKALAAAGEHGLVELIMATHAGMTTNEDNLACLRFDRFRVSIGRLAFRLLPAAGIILVVVSAEVAMMTSFALRRVHRTGNAT